MKFYFSVKSYFTVKGDFGYADLQISVFAISKVTNENIIKQ